MKPSHFSNGPTSPAASTRRWDWVGDNLLDVYMMAGKRSEAVRYITEKLAEYRQRFTPDSPELGGLLAATGKDLLNVDPAAAEPILVSA